MKQKLNKYCSIIFSVVIAIVVIVMFYLDLFYLASIILILYICIDIYFNNRYKSIEDSNKKLVVDIKNNINDNISNMSYPISLINENGDIIWFNKKLKDILNIEDLSNHNIISVARSLDLQKLLKCDKDLRQRIKINKSIYNIYANNVSSENSKRKVFMVYFIEVNNLRDFYSTKESVMLIEVDNLTDALDTADESDRPMIVAEVEKAINSYAQKMKAMIVKYEYNKYVLSIQDKYINDEINCKFNILDEISNIDRGNKIEVTLSVGVGSGGTTPQENYNNALTAKELALGRGGDQVVVKNNEKISFFGGNTREIEKRTRVRARVIAQALKELMFESSNLFIMGHKNPDMDCLGASIGLWAIAKQLGKNCSIILDDDTNAIEYYMAKLKNDNKYDNVFINSVEAEKLINDKTLLIIVDVHNKGYVQNFSISEKINRKIIIDHHRRSTDIIEGALLNYIEVYASSTSELVTELIQYMVQKPRMNKLEAEGLLAGIFMDTKNFQFKSGVRTFDAAAFLRSLGADTVEVKKMFTDSLEDYLVIADTIKTAKVSDGIAIAISPNETEGTVIVARAADELLSISGIIGCFVLSERKDSVIISGRSSGDINVQVILEELGGGGHMNMAGATVKGEMQEVLQQLQGVIEKHYNITFKE